MSQATSLTQIYRGYISAINAQDWESVKSFLHDPVVHNNRRMSKDEYCQLIFPMFNSCPDAIFKIDKLVVDGDQGIVAARIMIEGTPMKELFGNSADGATKVKFAENIFYEFENGQIVEANSLVDLAEAKKQLVGEK